MGGVLIPRLCGIMPTQHPPLDTSRLRAKKQWLRLTHLLLALGFFAGLFMENVTARWGLALPALVLWVEVGILWRLYRLPSKNARAISIWLAMWSLVLGTLLSALFPTHGIHLMHIAIVGGYVVTLLSVASHVVVNHEHK